MYCVQDTALNHKLLHRICIICTAEWPTAQSFHVKQILSFECAENILCVRTLVHIDAHWAHCALVTRVSFHVKNILFLNVLNISCVMCMLWAHCAMGTLCTLSTLCTLGTLSTGVSFHVKHISPGTKSNGRPLVSFARGRTAYDYNNFGHCACGSDYQQPAQG